MKMRTVTNVLTVVLVGISLAFSGCSGSGSSGTLPVAAGSAPSFHVKGSSQLIALSNTVAASGKPSSGGMLSKLLGKPELFSYKIVNQGLSSSDIKARLKGKASAPAAGNVTPVFKGTNLLAVDAQGNATLAISADFMVKIMYSVVDPAGQYVYLALDTGYVNPDGNDYSQFIAANDCAIYRVSLADNSYSCVQEGVYLQPIDDKYNQTVSANVKPIQFDANGFVYFPGAPFTSKCDSSGNCSLFVSNWNPKIYRYNPADQSTLTLTQDNQKISYYLALNTGQIAYQSVDNYGTSIYIWQPDTSGGTNPNGVTIDLTGSTNWITFFAADTYNTIIYGGVGNPSLNIPGRPGIRFGKPAPSGAGALTAVLDTSLFSQGYMSSPAPAKVIVGDDGKLYGVFGPNNEQRQEPTADGGTQWVWYDVYRLYQVLPALSVAKVEIRVNRGTNNTPPLFQPINIYGRTPFQVANGYFFYKETKQLDGYGLYDVIQMVDLNTRKMTTLLDGGVNGTTLYQIDSWRVRGNKLYFSALDLGRTQVVSGKIDTTLVAQGALQSTYLSTQNVASAVGASGWVQDVEGTTPISAPTATGRPYVKKFYATAENRYSLGIEFSQLMNETATEPAVSVTDDQKGSPVAALAVWIQNELHLIPDLDDNGTGLPNDALLDLNQSTPLDYNTPYTIAVGPAAKDRSGALLAAVDGSGNPVPSSKVLQTQPYGGWYISEDTAKYAGPYSSTSVTNYPDALGPYDLNLNIYSANVSTVIRNVPQNFRVEFDAKNTSYGALGVVLFDSSPTFSSSLYYSGGSEWQRNVYETYISSGYVQTVYARCDVYAGGICSSGGLNGWYSNGNYSDIMNGNWAKYRIDTYGNNQVVQYSVDGGKSWTVVQNAYPSTYYPTTINALVNRYPDDGTTHYGLYLLTGWAGGMSIDNLAVWQLDGAGNVVGTSPLMAENFNGRQEGTPGLNDAPALDGTVQNEPNLLHVTPWSQYQSFLSTAPPWTYLVY